MPGTRIISFEPLLRRHRQIRMQIHQLMDACLFAISFWLAYVLRSNLSEWVGPELTSFFRIYPIGRFDSFVWLY